MKNQLRELANYCVGTAESEDGLGCIDRIYVESSVVEEILDMSPGSPKLIVGHKGNGKTLILTALRNRLIQEKTDVLYVTPSDILDGRVPAGDEPAVLKDFYFKALVVSIARRLGSKTCGMVSGAEAVLLKEALNSGDKDPDFVEKCLQGLSMIGGLIGITDANKVTDKIMQPCGIGVTQRAVKECIGQQQKPFYVFIDEPDEVGTDGSATARVWGLLNACRELARRLTNVRCVVALRSEMWNLLRRASDGAKNIDHFEPLVTRIDPSDHEIVEILDRRLQFVAQKLNLLTGAPSAYDVFFEGDSVELPPPAHDEFRDWRDYLIKSSRDRPRDVIQYIRELASNALKSKRDKISSTDVHECAKKFSSHLLDLLVKEYEKDFPCARVVYKSFAGHPFSYPAEEIVKLLKGIIGYNHIVVRGKTLNMTIEEHVFTLWRMLHEAGFLNAYVADDRKRKGYRHINYEDESTLVEKSNYNNMKMYMWEVHPAYRSFLFGMSDDIVHRNSIMKQKKKFERNENYFDKKVYSVKRK